ncbi:hypothetical protein AB0D04_14895 [Streptomyces sp. NPDC048483]|uniref:hypothetical protein n=1 Tax=Streptomyces sp. NPDC048483 TaxID=3154927 RepID=UPI003432DE89
MSETPTPAAQAHARITALIKWLESLVDDLRYCDHMSVYEPIFKDPYPQSESNARKPRRSLGSRDAYLAAVTGRREGGA